MSSDIGSSQTAQNLRGFGANEALNVSDTGSAGDDDVGVYQGMDIQLLEAEAELRKATMKHEHHLDIQYEKHLETRSLLVAAQESVRKKEKEEEDRKANSKKLPPAELALAREMGLNPMEAGAMEKFFTYLQQMEEMDHSLDQVLREAAQNFSDISDQFAALSYARNLLSRKGSAENTRLSEEIRQAQADILNHPELGPQVRAGLNVIGEAQSFEQKGFAPTAELRDFFRSSVLGFATITETYAQIIKQYGPHRFPEALDFLIKALGHDLSASQGPSLAPERLGSIMKDLKFIQVLGNLYRVFSDITEQTKAMFKDEMDLDEKEAKNAGLSKDQRVNGQSQQQQSRK